MAIYNGHNEDASGNILLSIGNGMTATVETGTKTTQAYTKGALLFFNNKLCKTTKAIATNTTITIGTNVAQTSIGTELTSHLVSSDGKEFYFDVKDGKYGYYPSSSKTASEFVPFGGTATETILWSNSDTTVAFPETIITVPDITSYQFIGFRYGYNRADLTNQHTIYAKTTEFITTGVSGDGIVRYDLCSRSISHGAATRSVYYVSNTSVRIGNAFAEDAEYNSYSIPIKIVGLS